MVVKVIEVAIGRRKSSDYLMILFYFDVILVSEDAVFEVGRNELILQV